MMGWFGRRGAVDECRWLVADTETSGLDPARDRLLAIAAIAVRVDWTGGRLALDLGDSFEVILRQGQDVTAGADILLHGIGVRRQHESAPQADALRAFAAFAGNSPLLAFHAAFDQAVVRRHARSLGVALPNQWLDLQPLCTVHRGGGTGRTLDDWLAELDVPCAHRHQAAADALATSELLLRIWPGIAAECRSWSDVSRLAARARWLDSRHHG